MLAERASSRTLLIIIDDLHDADHASLKLLRFVSRNLASARILVVGTYRPAEISGSAALGEVIGDLSREARLMPLGGLSIAEVSRFVENNPSDYTAVDIAARLHAATGGNPLFVEGVLRILASRGSGAQALGSERLFELPHGVRESIRRRLSALSRGTNSLLSRAAILGLEFSAHRCRSLVNLSERTLYRALDESHKAGIISPLEPGRYRFTHGLIRNVIYNDIKAEARIRLHARTGELLERLYHNDPAAVLPELAHHFHEAQISGKAVDYAAQAAQQAEAVYAYADAVQMYAKAITALALEDPLNRFKELELVLAFAAVLLQAGNFPQSHEAFERASRIARELKAWDYFARAVVGFAGQPQDALTWKPEAKILVLIEEALEVHQQEDSLRSMLLARLAIEVQLRGTNSDRADMLFQQAIEVARLAGDDNALFNALNSRAFFRVLEPDQRELAEFAAIDRGMLERDGFWLLFMWIFRHHLATGDLQAMDESIEQYAPSAERSKLLGARSVLCAVRGIKEMMAGHLEASERLFQEAISILVPWDRFDASQFIYTLVPLRREQERLDEVLSVTRRAAQLFPSFKFNRATMAQVLLETGAESDARSEFEQLADEDFRGIPRDTNWLATLAVAASLCVRLGDARRMRILYDMLLPYTGRNVNFFVQSCLGPVAYYLGMLATALSRYQEAEKHFRQALELNLAMNASLFAAYTQREHARMLLARDGPGDREQALAMLQDIRRATIKLGLKGLERDLQMLEVRAASGGPTGNMVAANQQIQPQAIEGPAESLPQFLFRRDGDYWTITFDGRISRLRDLKGFHYLVLLLRHAHQEFAATELAHLVDRNTHAGSSAAGNSGQLPRELSFRSDLGDAGTLLDRRAASAYRERLRHLHREVEQAEHINDSATKDRLEREIYALTAELKHAAGRTGRRRVTGAHAERARSAVAKRLRFAISRIEMVSPALGLHLNNSIRTGYYCAYWPNELISWSF